jgi:hypothetical protein
MSKLIEFKHIYENKVCINCNTLLLFIRNIFSTSKKNCLFRYPEGYLLPLRWSSQKKEYVIDLGTSLQRDISGISLDNIDRFFKVNNDFKNAIRKILENTRNNNLDNYYNIHKNENKFIAVYYSLDEQKYYNTGLYTFTKSKKRNGPYHSSKKSLLIDKSEEFKNKIYDTFPIINAAENYKITESRTLYNKFLEEIKNKKFEINSSSKKILIDLKEEIEKNTKFKNTIKKERIKEIIKTGICNNKEEEFLIENILKNIISLELYNFLIKNNIIKSKVYYYDSLSDTNFIIKDLSNSFKDTEMTINQAETLNIDYSFMLPKKL